MTDKAALKEDVKKLVRALLISAPLGLTIRQVEEDFEAVMGYRLPYQKLGYDSASDMFNDMKDVVKPVWDRGQMKVMGICDDTTRHIQKMVMRQKVDTRKRGGTSKITRPTAQQHRSYRKMPAIRNTNYSNFGKTQNSSNYASRPRQIKPMNQPVVPAHLQFEIKELLISFPNGIHATNFPKLFQDEYGYMIDYSRLNFSSYLEMFKCVPDLEVEMLKSGGYRISDKSQLIKPTVIINNEPKEQIKRQGPLTPPSKVGHRDKPKRTDNFDDAFIKNLRTILSHHTSGVWATKLPFAYRKLTGIELKLSKYGFFNVIDLVSAIPDVITIERPDPTGDWLLFDARLRLSEPRPKQTRSKERPNESKPEKIKLTLDQLKIKIRKVLEKTPGILVQQLESAYEEMFGEELPLQDHGFMDVDTLVVMIPEALNVVYKGRGRLYLYPSQTIGSVPQISHSKVPSDAIGSGVAYKYNDLPPIQEYIEVYVSNVVSPYNLTLQLKGDELMKLEAVMDELEEVYCSEVGEKYKIIESMITINQVCAALYQQDHNWHRAIITGITNLDFVEVKYVDYGTTASVPKGLVRFLRPSMFHLPVQSYDARLSFIQPVKDKWTKPVQDRILQLCSDKPVVALITSIQGRELSVCLTDTSTDEDIHVNDVLVSENLAAFASSTVNVKPYSEYSLVTGYGLDIPTLVYDGSSYGASAEQVNNDESVVTDKKEEIAKPSPLTPPRLTLPNFNRLSIDPPVMGTGLYTPAGAEEDAREEVVICAVASQDVEELVDEELMEQMNREMGGDFDDLDCSRFVMYLDLGNDRTIHLINYNDVAYVPSSNLRTLIDVDAVSQVMEIKQLGIQSVSLSREENQELFAELDEYEVTRGPAGDSQPDSRSITLYPLERIPSLVAVFEDKSSELRLSSILTKVFEQFNPLDTYWKGEITPAETKDESVSDDLDLLKLMLQVSERKRQRILIAMMEDGGNVMVDELTEIEQQIAFIKSKIKAMQIETEEIERGIVGDLVSQGHESSASHHTSSTSRHTSVPGDYQVSYPDTGKDSTDIEISSPVSVKSEKIISVGETQRKMNVVEPFKPSVDIANLEINENTATESFKQPEIYNRTEQYAHKGTTYYTNSVPQQHQSNAMLNQNQQSYMHHFRPSLPPPQSYVQPQAVTLKPQRNMLQAPPGLPQPPPGLPQPPPGLPQPPPGLRQQQQLPTPNMHVAPMHHMQPNVLPSHVQQNVLPSHVQPNVQPPHMQQNVQPPHMQQNIQQLYMQYMQQPYIQNPQMHVMQPQFNQPMTNQTNSMHQTLSRFSTGQYYGNQAGQNYGNAYMGQPVPSPSPSMPFPGGQPAAGIRLNYGSYWSTQQ